MPLADLACDAIAGPPRRARSEPSRIVLMTRSLDLGGSERQLVEVARSLDRTSFDPVVACFDGSGMRAEELRLAGVPVVEFPVRSFRSPAAVGVGSAFFRWLRRRGVRIVHPFDVPTVLFAVPIARAARVPIVLASQRGDRRLFSSGSQHALRVTDHLVDGVVVNSEYIRRVLVAEYGLADDRIHTCPNALDTARFRPDGPSHKHEFPDSARIVGAVTVLRPEKAVDTLIAAFAMLADRRTRLVIVGDGPCKADLQALARRLEVDRRCTFVPATPEVSAWYRTFDVFVLASLNESFSNSLMEAMACGCAVVASRVGGNPELVRDDETGKLFEAGNAGDLAARLDEALADPVARRRLAAAGLTAVRDGYSLERAAGRFAALYREMLDRAAAARRPR